MWWASVEDFCGECVNVMCVPSVIDRRLVCLTVLSAFYSRALVIYNGDVVLLIGP